MVKSPFALDERELRLAARFGLVTGDSLRHVRLAVILIAVAWLPLLLLTLKEGTTYGGVTVPLFSDFLAYGRYLIALPLLVFLHPAVDHRITAAVATLQTTGLVPSTGQSSLLQLLDRAGALWRNTSLRPASFRPRP